MNPLIYFQKNQLNNVKSNIENGLPVLKSKLKSIKNGFNTIKVKIFAWKKINQKDKEYKNK